VDGATLAVGSFSGKYRSPVWPHALTIHTQVARANALHRICEVFNMVKL
jgi:hypothetical protein